MERAGFQLRMWAYLIDFAVCAVALHGAVLLDVAYNSNQPRYFGMLSAVLGAALVVAYGLIDLSPRGSFGKRVLKLSVLRDDAGPAARGTLVRRWALKHGWSIFGLLATAMLVMAEGRYVFDLGSAAADALLAMGVVDAIIGGVLLLTLLVSSAVLLRSRQQAVHDLIAGTAVYRGVEAVAQPGFEPLVRRVEAVGESQHSPELKVLSAESRT